MVEAYLGACFVDSGFNFEVVETFYQRHVQPYFHDMAIYDTFANKHPTVRLPFINPNIQGSIKLIRSPDISAQQAYTRIWVYKLLPESRRNA